MTTPAQREAAYLSEALKLIKEQPLAFVKHARASVILDGTANKGQLAAPFIPLFNLSGHVKIITTATRIDGAVSAAAGTLELGTTSQPAQISAASLTVDAASGFIIAGASPIPVATSPMNGTLDVDKTEQVGLTVGTGDITTGTVTSDVWYLAIEDNGEMIGV